MENKIELKMSKIEELKEILAPGKTWHNTEDGEYVQTKNGRVWYEYKQEKQQQLKQTNKEKNKMKEQIENELNKICSSVDKVKFLEYEAHKDLEKAIKTLTSCLAYTNYINTLYNINEEKQTNIINKGE